MPHFQMLEKCHYPTIFLFGSFNLDLMLESAKMQFGFERKDNEKIKGNQQDKEHYLIVSNNIY